jgi:hypothetical protein
VIGLNARSAHAKISGQINKHKLDIITGYSYHAQFSFRARIVTAIIVKRRAKFSRFNLRVKEEVVGKCMGIGRTMNGIAK